MASSASRSLAILLLVLVIHVCTVEHHVSAVRIFPTTASLLKSTSLRTKEEAAIEAAKKAREAAKEALQAGKSPEEVKEEAKEAAKESVKKSIEKKLNESLVCFPASAKVSLFSGELKPMAELAIGDRVAIGRGAFSSVFMFTHALPHVQHIFVSITTAAGPSITLTSTHHLYVNGALKAAGFVVEGDTLELLDGSMTRVVRVDNLQDIGLYNPQTLHGDIVIDGVRASTYTEAVRPSLAHALLSPLRAAYTHAHATCGAIADGAPRFARMLSRIDT